MKLIKHIFQHPVFRITSLNSVSVMIRIVTGLVSTSVVAKVLGPSGVALLGNLRNFITSLETIAVLGFNNGIVKYVAEHNKNQQELQKIISTVFWTLLVASITVAFPLFILADYWNLKIFGTAYDFSIVFKTLALSIPLFALNVFLVAIINGLSEFKKVIYINIAGNFIGFVFTILMILQYKTLGALLAMALVPLILFGVSWFWVSRTLSLKQYIKFDVYDVSVLKNLSAYSLMAFVSAFCLPLVYLQIRSEAIATLGIDNAGNWEAMNRLASFYLVFVSTLLSVYFFPKLSQSKTDSQTKGIFMDYYKSIIPMFIAGGLLLYFSRHLLITLIYSDRFMVLSELFFWQLLGDLFKVASLILGYQFFAKRMTVAFLSTEVLSIVVLYLSSTYLMKTFGVQGLVMAHTITYAIYLLVLLVMFRKIVFAKTK
ncbi:MAG TPA: O-antigen translocase [Flavobacterium sp.]|nr:O-antigen translocase [Flavobacterium sp.]